MFLIYMYKHDLALTNYNIWNAIKPNQTNILTIPLTNMAQSAGAVEYTNCIYAER